jgi:hypothetical protein
VSALVATPSRSCRGCWAASPDQWSPGQASSPKLVYKPPPTVKELVSAVPKGWTPPKTTWGEPDFQGIWSYATLTPPAARLFRLLGLHPGADLSAIGAAALAGAPGPRKGRSATTTRWLDYGRSDERTSLIVDPPNGRRPPLTPEGQKRLAERAAYRRAHPADSWEDLTLALRCISFHGVPPIPSAYGNNYQIFQTPGYVVMYDEELTGARRIPTNRSSHPSKAVGLWNGDSSRPLGGNTLVVGRRTFEPDASVVQSVLPIESADLTGDRALHAARAT